jgi:ferredoxin-type protein NapH
LNAASAAVHALIELFKSNEMTPLKKNHARNLSKALSFSIVAMLAVGGFFYPVLGLAVPALMVIALVMNVRSRRSFCAGACPNGKFLAIAVKPVSRNKRIPRALVSPHFRRMLCGVMMFCVIGLFFRGYPDYSVIGRAFWSIYLIALSAGIIFGLIYKPRAWCTFCPLGTLQDTVGDKPKETSNTAPQ